MNDFLKLLAKLSLCAFLAVPSMSAFADVTKVMTVESVPTEVDSFTLKPIAPMLTLRDVTKV